MPSTIVFAAARGEQALAARVEEDPNQVHDAWVAAQGHPFQLTESGASDRKIWINPATVAYWHETKSSTASFA